VDGRDNKALAPVCDGLWRGHDDGEDSN
jgi:hypothetical protein